MTRFAGHSLPREGRLLHYYRFNIADYRKDTSHLSPIEHYIYRYLLDWLYLDESPIQDDKKSILRRLSLCEDELPSLENVLNDFFVLAENGWMNKRVMIEVAEYAEYLNKQKINGSKGGRPRKPNAKQWDNDGLGMECQAKPRKSLTTNHKPITKNHKPEKKAGRFQRPTREQLIQEFSNRVHDPERAADKFLNWFESNGWVVGKAKAPMKSWKPAVTSWILNDQDKVTALRPANTPEAVQSAIERLTDTSWADEVEAG
jgi:uncharacterized protein YdaU (DUF1376 family)